MPTGRSTTKLWNISAYSELTKTPSWPAVHCLLITMPKQLLPRCIIDMDNCFKARKSSKTQFTSSWSKRRESMCWSTDWDPHLTLVTATWSGGQWFGSGRFDETYRKLTGTVRHWTFTATSVSTSNRKSLQKQMARESWSGFVLCTWNLEASEKVMVKETLTEFHPILVYS